MLILLKPIGTIIVVKVVMTVQTKQCAISLPADI